MNIAKYCSKSHLGAYDSNWQHITKMTFSLKKKLYFLCTSDKNSRGLQHCSTFYGLMDKHKKFHLKTTEPIACSFNCTECQSFPLQSKLGLHSGNIYIYAFYGIFYGIHDAEQLLTILKKVLVNNLLKLVVTWTIKPKRR